MLRLLSSQAMSDLAVVCEDSALTDRHSHADQFAFTSPAAFIVSGVVPVFIMLCSLL
jgi:hypothetical protein